jgi:hypothetical protein
MTCRSDVTDRQQFTPRPMRYIKLIVLDGGLSSLQVSPHRYALLHESKLISPVALCWGTYSDVVEPCQSTIRGGDSPSARVQ